MHIKFKGYYLSKSLDLKLKDIYLFLYEKKYVRLIETDQKRDKDRKMHNFLQINE